MRKSLAVRCAATLVAIGIALATAQAIDQAGAIASTARLLAFGIVPAAVLGSRQLVAGIGAVLAAVARPTVRFALLTAAGIGVAIGAVVVNEREEEFAIEREMAELALLESHVESIPVERETVSTDRGTRVVVRQPASEHDHQYMTETEEHYFRNAHLKETVIRTGTADERTNCHGWVFTGGKFIVTGSEVDLILNENGYTKQKAPRAGDLVIYRSSGAVTHTAVVQYVSGNQPVLVSGKWGPLGVFLHPIDKSPYGTDYAFYRSPRAGHLLTNRSPAIAGKIAPSTASE